MSSAGPNHPPAEAPAGPPTGVDPGPTPVLVLGLGNPVLGDDGVGWRVIDELGRDPRGIGPAELDRLAVGGVALMERLVGWERAILIDAFATGECPLGTVTCMRLDDTRLRDAAHLDSEHDAPLSVAIAAGRRLGAAIPADITVVAIEVVRADCFGESLSAPVEAAVPRAVDAIVDLLGIR
jgi:hydrogenase maturation protease